MAQSIVNPTVNDKLTKLSVYVNGKWVFANLGSPSYQVGMEEYYQIVYPFGLVNSTEINPEKLALKGKIGDYVTKITGNPNLGTITKSYFKNVVEVKSTQKPDPKPMNSNALSNPEFLTCIVETGKPPVYNKQKQQKKQMNSKKEPCSDCGA